MSVENNASPHKQVHIGSVAISIIDPGFEYIIIEPVDSIIEPVDSISRDERDFH